MKLPEDALAPLTGVFAEPWHAQTLAAAHGLIRAGHITPTEWAKALGAALAEAEARGAPDTEETYYLSALSALEGLAPLNETELAARKADWEAAYRRTPHGKPVRL